LNLAIIVLPLVAAAQPSFEVETSTGKVELGRVVQFSAEGKLLLDGDRVIGDSIVLLRRVSTANPGFPACPRLELHNGDCLAGEIHRLADAILLVRPRSFRVDGEAQLLRLPLSAVSRYWQNDPDGMTRDVRRTVASKERPRDLAVLDNGDIVAGTLLEWSGTNHSLVMQSGNDQRSIKQPQLAALAFSTATSRVRKPTGTVYRLTLTDGSRWTLSGIDWKDQRIRGTDLFRNSIVIEAEQLVFLDVINGKAQSLLDVKPAQVVDDSIEMDATSASFRPVTGLQPLQLKTGMGISHYDDGITTMGEARIDYALEPDASRFECTVGLDPVRGARGHVRLAVLLDGKPLPIDRPTMTLADGVKHLNLKVEGAKLLSLVVEAADGGTAGDCVNWCRPRLIRK